MGVVDMDLISSRFRTHKWICKQKLRYLVDAIAIFFLVAFTDVTVTRWAHIQAYWLVRWAKLLRKKSVVIIGGGADTVDEEWLGRKYTQEHLEMLAFILNNATRLIANSEYVRGTLRKYTARDDIPVIYDGFDPAVYFHDNRTKEQMVVSVSPIRELEVKRKGIETLTRAAGQITEAKFVIIGSFLDASIERLRSIAPPNVLFTGYVENPAKIEYMRRAKVYAQLSSLEGCPWAISEAMLCECVPVATKGGGIPEVAGDTAFYAQYGDVESTVRALKLALASTNNRHAARARILDSFSIQLRQQKLEAEIRRLTSAPLGTVGTDPRRAVDS